MPRLSVSSFFLSFCLFAILSRLSPSLAPSEQSRVIYEEAANITDTYRSIIPAIIDAYLNNWNKHIGERPVSWNKI